MVTQRAGATLERPSATPLAVAESWLCRRLAMHLSVSGAETGKGNCAGDFREGEYR